MRVGIRAAASVLTVLIAGTALAGCARAGAVVSPTGSTQPTPASANRQAEVYISVLRRYLTSGDNSFGSNPHFPAVYVMDKSVTGIADPTRTTGPAQPIPVDAQRQITQALVDIASIRFIDDRDEVIETKDNCARVRGGGILITLGPVPATGNHATIGISGFVACLGATWFSYAVDHTDTGWHVTGIVGPQAIA